MIEGGDGNMSPKSSKGDRQCHGMRKSWEEGRGNHHPDSWDAILHEEEKEGVSGKALSPRPQADDRFPGMSSAAGLPSPFLIGSRVSF